MFLLYRFKPPIPINQKDLGTIDTSEISSVKCPQNSMLDPTSVTGQEDCLLLNIYIPKTVIENPKEKVPVMFYIHGGAMIMGKSRTCCGLFMKPQGNLRNPKEL